MKKLLMLLVCLSFVGCDYLVPITTAPSMPIDKSVLGAWMQTKIPESAKKVQRLVILPFNDKEYMVVYSIDSDNTLFAKACLVKVGKMTLAQIEWLGTVKGAVDAKKDKHLFQYAEFAVVGKELRIRLLNPKVINKDINVGKELVAAIENEKENSALFRDAMYFKKTGK